MTNISNKILRRANLFYKKSSVISGPSISSDVAFKDADLAIKKMADEDWKKDPQSIDDFRKKWEVINDVIDTLGEVPAPVNPFAVAMLGNDVWKIQSSAELKQSDVIQVTLDIIEHLSGLPDLQFLRSISSVGRSPSFLRFLYQDLPLKFRPIFVRSLAWTSRHIRNEKVIKGIAYGIYSATKKAIEELIDITQKELVLNSFNQELDKPKKDKNMEEIAKEWSELQANKLKNGILKEYSEAIREEVMSIEKEEKRYSGSFEPSPLQLGEIDFATEYKGEGEGKTLKVKFEDPVKDPVKMNSTLGEVGWINKLKSGRPDISSLNERLRQIDLQRLDSKTTEILKERALKAYEAAVEKYKSR